MQTATFEEYDRVTESDEATASSLWSAQGPARAFDDFKSATIGKLRGLECPHHGQQPQVSFHGASLRDVSISVRSCCSHLSTLANQALAAGTLTTDGQTLPKLRP